MSTTQNIAHQFRFSKGRIMKNGEEKNNNNN